MTRADNGTSKSVENVDYQAVMQRWVDTVIVKYNICPFARREVEQQSIRYAVCAEQQQASVLEALARECEHLDENPNVATTLLVIPAGFEGFYDYLKLLDHAEALLQVQGYEGIYQLASFHPDYCFDGEPQQDPANYTNRAPYPALHILREESLSEALANYDEPETIPERNIAFARRKGADFFESLLAACRAGQNIK